MGGFRYHYRLSGASPTVRSIPLHDARNIRAGDMVSFEAGALRAGTTGDERLVGVALGAATSGTGAELQVVVDADAVYGVHDANQRARGASLTLTGATGDQGVETAHDGALEVVVGSSSIQETLIRIRDDRRHALDSVARAAPGEAGAGGRLNAAIANAVVRLLGRYAGRGPPKAQAFFRQNVVVVVMEEQLTRAERTLVAAGRREIVHQVRRELRMTMRADLTAAIEELTGRGVVAMLGDNHVEPELAVEIFVLDRPVERAD